MKDSKKAKHGLEDEPLGNEDQKAEDGPKSFEDKRPADLEIPKGDHPNTDTSRNPSDWEKELGE
ncbi:MULTISPECIES: hypothetical protein [unclassified Pedobacter]|uniref:hypothetical protein n=1 Tax=unclassified Pedobacter TaxID=2628915 RepID=UPI001D1ABBBD|nr:MULTISPECIES: hypothetical protein [unclassified Pedobacter]CAH0126575.1 hypothetical protein SRABI36_00153 [Pedobacter sp. Bi36]CAH0180658.1 hypothetical protein SRABI126_01249 [Pedobacter sp. Bi126]